MTFIDNKRWKVRRATTSGIVPVAPSSGVTSQEYPDSTWADNAIMDGELFANIADNKLWLKCTGDTPVLIASLSGTTEFVDLSDTPSTYVGAANKVVVVNSGATGLEFVTLTDTDQFTELTDTPDSYVGYSGYAVTVTTDGTGLTFTQINQSVTGLTDVSMTDYTAGQLLITNGTQFTAVTDTDYYVTLTDDQTITGLKTFTAQTVFDGGVTITQPLNFSGASENVIINDIITDGTFSAVTDNSIATSYAVKQYVDLQVFGTGGTGNFVTLDTNQTIDGDKEFDGDVTFNAGVNFVDLTVGELTVTGDTFNNITSYNYIGDETTDGSWRNYIHPSTDLVWEKRVSGVWTWAYSITI